jgi:hypothetical protein
MPMGTRHRLTGVLQRSPRGLLLRMEDGGGYSLDVDMPTAALIGRRVIVEGMRSGFDCIDVDFIGAASD